jgi:signal transduction histidine kinase
MDQASRSVRLAAAEAERGRWARELHDETLQSLGALRLTLATAARSQPPEKLSAAIGQAVEQLEDMIADLRALITDLRPAALDELGVQAALDALAERVAHTGIEVDVSIDLAYEQGRAAGRHTPELETAVYRIVQEALSNASKHGQAKRIAVEVHEDETAIHLSIRDDGRGFDQSAKTDGFGLLGIHERVELLEGILKIESSPERGTVVRATLPTPPPASAPPASAPPASAPPASAPPASAATDPATGALTSATGRVISG